jgi:hypothetical protein
MMRSGAAHADCTATHAVTIAAQHFTPNLGQRIRTRTRAG